MLLIFLYQIESLLISSSAKYRLGHFYMVQTALFAKYHLRRIFAFTWLDFQVGNMFTYQNNWANQSVVAQLEHVSESWDLYVVPAYIFFCYPVLKWPTERHFTPVKACFIHNLVLGQKSVAISWHGHKIKPDLNSETMHFSFVSDGCDRYGRCCAFLSRFAEDYNQRYQLTRPQSSVIAVRIETRERNWNTTCAKYVSIPIETADYVQGN